MSEAPFKSEIYSKNLLIPAELFNNNPLETLQLYIGKSSTVKAYEVSNGINENNLLTVKVYYEALNFDLIYYIEPSNLKQFKVINQTSPQYIVNNVLIQIPKQYEEKNSIVPITIRPLSNVTKINNEIVLTNYYGRLLKTPFRYFTTITKSHKLYIPPLFELSKPKNIVEYNSYDSNITSLDDVYKKATSISKELFEKPTNIDYEKQQTIKFLSNLNLNSEIIKQINSIEYIDKPPKTLPKDLNLGYLILYSDELRKFLKNYHLGILLATTTRTVPNLVLFIPTVAVVLTEDQINSFEQQLLIDIINYANLKYCDK